MNNINNDRAHCLLTFFLTFMTFKIAPIGYNKRINGIIIFL